MPATQSFFSPLGHSKLPFVSGVGAGTLMLPFDFNTPDGFVLFTMPVSTSHFARVVRAYWSVVTGFTGGTSSAIGISSSNAGANTKGDILGGASGDVTATLGTAGAKAGTIGAKIGTSSIVILGPGDTLRFDRIASQFAAGAGFVFVELHEVGPSLTSNV